VPRGSYAFCGHQRVDEVGDALFDVLGPPLDVNPIARQRQPGNVIARGCRQGQAWQVIGEAMSSGEEGRAESAQHYAGINQREKQTLRTRRVQFNVGQGGEGPRT